ncbi:hypothetical protein L195_g056730, partial [Trifolium pratense]
MSESSQTTKSARSTRSKAKIESALVIKDAVPVTTIHPSNLKPETAAEKKGKMKTAEKKKKTIKKTSETNEGEPQNPEVVETIIPTTDNPSQVNLGSDAEKKDLNSKPVETEMEDIPTE